MQSYKTAQADYPSIRTFYRPHAKADKLPTEPRPIPLLVFVPGLGGSLAQFAPLLGSLVNIAPCLGIDYPGCGRSAFAPTHWEAYSTEALVSLLEIAIERHRDRANGQGVVLIAHSMGGSISALLASSTSPAGSKLRAHILGLVAVCPLATPPDPKKASMYRKLLYLPDFILDFARVLDRRGGPESAGVARFVGRDAVLDTKKLQQRFNAQFPTPVWRRTAWGSIPSYRHADTAKNGIPGRDVWAGLDMPLYLIAGEADTVTPPTEVSKIVSYLKKQPYQEEIVQQEKKGHPHPADPAASSASSLADEKSYGMKSTHTEFQISSKEKAHLSDGPRPDQVVKTSILPAPAAHALLYDHSTFRTLAGLIQDFLADHVDSRLALGWQLQHLTTSEKWDVKNLKKWQGVAPVSDTIAGMFRALKTLREQDELHTPPAFVKNWRGKIFAVIDISHDHPTYNPSELEKGGIQYHKFPTVSKIPPTPDEVREFNALVARLRAEIARDDTLSEANPAIGVHCHYGYNRTGFFIASHLIESKGFTVEQAVKEFAQKRPPGIRHEHFIDTLYVRYCVGLKRAPTLKQEESER